MNTSQVIVADAKALIAKGKSAVEESITAISKAEAEAAVYIKSERVKLTTALQDYLNTHSAEVSAAQDLLRQVGTQISTTAASIVPAATLAANTSGSLGTKIKTFLGAIGWKGWVLIAVGVGALHALHKHGII